MGTWGVFHGHLKRNLKLEIGNLNKHNSAGVLSNFKFRISSFSIRLLSEYFDVLDVDRILLFADRFGLRELINKYLSINNHPSEGPHNL